MKPDMKPDTILENSQTKNPQLLRRLQSHVTQDLPPVQAKLRTSLVAWSGVIAAILLVVGAMAYRSIAGLISDTNRVTHTHIIIGTLSETFSLLKDVQGGQRGYVITGQEEYLVPYRAAIPRIEQNLQQLLLLTADNPAQQQLLSTLRTKIGKRLQHTQQVVVTRRRDGFAAAQRIVSSGVGQREMDSIRVLVTRLESEEKRLLEQRSTRVQAASRVTLLTGGIGLLVVVAIIFLMLNLVRRESLRRMEVESGLATSNQKLQDSLGAMESLTREMMMTATLSEMLQSCRTTDEAYSVIARLLPQLMPGVGASLGLINASQNLVEVVLEIPVKENRQKSLYSPEDCWALRSGHMYLTRDTSVDVLCPHLAGCGSKPEDQTPPNSTICLPLVAYGESLGVLTFADAHRGSFTEPRQRIALSVTERIALSLANLNLQETLRTQSIRDPLSGLFNRRYLEVSFERELSRAARHEHPLSVIMIDIDFFKRFNDSYGHEAGDLLLQKFGSFLESNSRGEDVVCRYGGEEFMLLLPETSPSVAQRRAEQLRVGVSQMEVQYRRQTLPAITISAGVATFPTHGLKKDELMRAADAALYRAKKAGRDQVAIASLAELNAS